MKKIIILILFAVSLSALAGAYWIKSSFQIDFSKVKITIPGIVEIIKKEISAPPPLISREQEDFGDDLTKQGIINWTNRQRDNFGASFLRENMELSLTAQFKIEDMFESQYFAHESPSGEGVGDIADMFGYKYISVGENLAMGIFKDDKSLVDAWMASQGHKENIINPNYNEIGVAVKRGIFEGKTVWMAVQHFGTSIETCPLPSKAMEFQIEEKNQELEIIKKALLELENELRVIRPKWSNAYRQKLNDYNNLAEKYNNLLSEINDLVGQYNSQTKQFNQCVEELLK